MSIVICQSSCPAAHPGLFQTMTVSSRLRSRFIFIGWIEEDDECSGWLVSSNGWFGKSPSGDRAPTRNAWFGIYSRCSLFPDHRNVKKSKNPKRMTFPAHLYLLLAPSLWQRLTDFWRCCKFDIDIDLITVNTLQWDSDHKASTC